MLTLLYSFKHEWTDMSISDDGWWTVDRNARYKGFKMGKKRNTCDGRRHSRNTYAESYGFPALFGMHYYIYDGKQPKIDGSIQCIGHQKDTAQKTIKSYSYPIVIRDS